MKKNFATTCIHTFLSLVLVLSLMSFGSVACHHPITIATETPDTLKKDTTLLFVGNSLTYSNNLPQLVADFAQSKGRHIKVEMLALPNYALVDHLADGNVQKMIATKQYQYVIVQQGPSSQLEGRTLLLEAATTFKTLCQENDAKLAFYMVWPAFANYYNFDGVIRNYTEAATTTNALLCPVGTVWKAYIDRTHDLSYYGDDQFHPSLKGSQIAAEVIYESLFK
ncbi:MAG: hypothetical protein JNL70_10470 [Saprospiraceae bacterium]|nr:hypothetical protein [Saprospiraceae bacterium]